MLELLFVALLQTAPASVTTIDRGVMSGIEMPRQAVVRTAAEWSMLWSAHAPGRPAPSVDLSKNMVLGVFLGTRPTGGFSVEIARTRNENGVLVVEYVEGRPAADAVTAQILTAPYHLVSVPARAGTVRFEKVEK